MELPSQKEKLFQTASDTYKNDKFGLIMKSGTFKDKTKGTLVSSNCAGLYSIHMSKEISLFASILLFYTAYTSKLESVTNFSNSQKS
jgi:hypothetical protein